MKRLRKVVTAGFILAVFLMGCGHPLYRLDGMTDMRQVALLDPTASGTVDSLHAEFEYLIDMLAKGEVGAVDSMKKSASSLAPSISRAQKSLRNAREKYKLAFQKMQQFRSFGGNPVFSDEDRSVSTEELQSQILGRFYKGRAFSLETQGQIRSFVRNELVPLEKLVNQAKNRANRLRRSRDGRSNATEEIAAQYQKKRKQLAEEINLKIKQTILERQLLVVDANSVGEFAFEKTHSGEYDVYAESADSTGYLTQLTFSAHTRLNVVPRPSLAIGVAVPPVSTQ